MNCQILLIEDENHIINNTMSTEPDTTSAVIYETINVYAYIRKL